MQVFHKLEDVPAGFGPTVVTVGNFDGVHRAHCHVLNDIVRRAREQGLKAVAVTFEPHPVRILRPDSGLKLLTPTPEKLRLLEATGLDAVLLLPFARDLSLMTPRQFVEEILKKRLQAREVHEGYNFRFGHKAAGDINLLIELGREMGFEVKVYSEMNLRGEPVSSSHIRKLLAHGQASRARHLLGRPFSIVVDCHSGFGTRDRVWFPYAHTARPMANVRRAEAGCKERGCRVGGGPFPLMRLGGRPAEAVAADGAGVRTRATPVTFAAAIFAQVGGAHLDDGFGSAFEPEFFASFHAAV